MIEECKELIRRISRTCTPPSSTALALLHQHPHPHHHHDTHNTHDPQDNPHPYTHAHIPSDVPTLDRSLRGGFRMGQITEIVGRAGVGKTQLALQLAIVAARLGHGCGTIFLDTEKKLSLERLNEMARVRYEYEYESEKDDGGSGAEERANQDRYKHPIDVMNNVTVHAPSSTNELLTVLSKLDEEIILRNEESANRIQMSSSNTGDTHTRQREQEREQPTYPVKLIILDSIAATTKRDYAAESSSKTNANANIHAPQRVAAIFQIAQILKRIADQMQVAVVVINQIDQIHLTPNNHDRDGIHPGTGTGAVGKDVGSCTMTAALGTSWHHCITTRVELEHERDPHRQEDDWELALDSNVRLNSGRGRERRGVTVDERARVRTATVAKSNLVGTSSISYEVTTRGICQV
jgi:RecA/RadA recombinase